MAIFIPRKEETTNRKPAWAPELDYNNWQTDSLVAFFPMLHGLPAGYDLSGNDNHAADVANPPTVSEDVYIGDYAGKGYENDYLEATIENYTQFTMSCRVTTPNTGSSQSPFSYFPEGSSDRITLAYDNSPSDFGIWDSSNGWVRSGVVGVANSVHHWCITYNSALARKLYLDGVLVGTDTTISAFTSNNTLGLGVRGNNGGDIWRGATADHRFYSRVFDAKEIAEIYQNPNQIYKPSRTLVAVPSGVTGTTSTTSGTTTENITEADIVAGGKTTILTLTNDTWVAAGATFDAQRQAIIDGNTSGQTETFGWNNEVRDKASVTDVARTDDNTVTIIWGAAAAYDITAQETITPGIPAAAMVNSTVDVVSSPAFTVDFVANLALTFSGTTSANTSDQATLAQNHILAQVDTSSGNASDNIALSGAAALSQVDTLSANASDQVALSQNHSLTQLDTLSANESASLTLLQKHSLALTKTSSTRASVGVTLIQHSLLALVDSLSSNTSDQISTNQNHAITSTDTASLSVSALIDITVAGTLVQSDTSSANTSDTLTLIENAILAFSDTSSPSTSAQVLLYQAHLLALVDSITTQNSDALSLVSKSLLALLDSSSANISDSVSVTDDGILSARDTLSQNNSDDAALTQQHVMSVVNSINQSISESIVLTEYQSGCGMTPEQDGLLRAIYLAVTSTGVIIEPSEKADIANTTIHGIDF